MRGHASIGRAAVVAAALHGALCAAASGYSGPFALLTEDFLAGVADPANGFG